MNAQQVYQEGLDKNAGLGCLGPIFSFFMMAVVSTFFPKMNFFLFLIIWLTTSSLITWIIMGAAQKHWKDQWKDSCLTRSGMKI